LVAGCIRRIECELGQEPFSRREPRRDVLQLNEIQTSDMRVGVKSLQVWRVPLADIAKISRPAGVVRAQTLNQIAERGPVLLGRGGWAKSTKHMAGLKLLGHAFKQLAGCCRPYAR
jgi:hypothetical protein